MNERNAKYTAWFEKAEHDLLSMPDEPGEVDARAAVDMAHRIRDAILQRVAPGEAR